MSAPHADDRAHDRTEDRRNGHPAAGVLDGPLLPHPRPAPSSGTGTDRRAGPDGTSAPGGTDAPAASAPGGTAAPDSGVPRDGTGHEQTGVPAPRSAAGPAAPPHPRITGPTGPGAAGPVGPAPGATELTGPVQGPPPGPRTPPMPWPAVPPTGAPVPQVYPGGRPLPERHRQAGRWSPLPALRAVDTARLAGSVRAAVPHRTAAVAVGATLALAVGVVVAAYAGTGGSDDGGSAGAGAGAPAAGAAVAVSADLVAGSTAADPAAFGDVATFTSPSGNIACRVDGGEARCDVADRQWSAEGADGCTDPGLVVARAGGSRASCDPAPAPAGGAELGYDTHVTRGDVTCVSRRTGVECRDAASGHGFSAARASYRLY